MLFSAFKIYNNFSEIQIVKNKNHCVFVSDFPNKESRWLTILTDDGLVTYSWLTFYDKKLVRNIPKM